MPLPKDNPIREILEFHIIPYVVSARRLKWQPFYVLYNVHVYSRDILAGLIGVGISNPVMHFTAKALGSDAGGNIRIDGIGQQGQSLWLLVVALAGVALVGLRVWVNNSKAGERAPLLKACADKMRAASLDLNTVLDTRDPISALHEMRNKMTTIANSHVGVWPWDYEPAPGIQAEVQDRVERLCERFGAKWLDATMVQQMPESEQVSTPSMALQSA